MKRVHLLGLALLLVALAASAAVGAEGAATPPPAAQIDLRANETLLSFPAPAAPATGEARPELGAVVALPSDATRAEVHLVSGRAAEVRLAGEIMRLRGQPLVNVQVLDPTGPVTVAVRHDGSWAGKADARLSSSALHAGLPGLPETAGHKSADHPLGGSYVIITAPEYESAVVPLADWKTRKGWPVVSVTTQVTGPSREDIKAWLQEAYDTWQRPPEYVLLVGDVDVIPSFAFSSNVTDLPYSLLDGDDWLPDVLLGRFSVSNQTECQAMVAKTLHYEQTPYRDQTHWFTRAVMVAGQYASTTPMHTVRFCGEQLASIGFDPVDPATPTDLDGNYIVSPFVAQEGVGIPQNFGPQVIKDSIDQGASFVVYRGWAYGTAGWEPPHYTVEEVPQLTNGAMLPVVMSFVCLNGDFSATEPCFGEVFTRIGGTTPEAFKGAVAFVGNGEHWSHTRYNDAMAISVFERAIDPEITSLASLLLAGKLRFMEYFPGQLNDVGDEESVEFYFHIYNLLGDPELNFYRALPTDLTATHLSEVPSGTTLLDVSAHEADGSTPVPGARVGVAQGGELLGAAITDENGSARVVLSSPVADGPVNLAISHPDRVPYQTQLNAAAAEIYLALDAFALADAAGNGDGIANAGETLAITPTMRNLGTQTSSNANLVLGLDGPATITAGSVAVGPVAAGAAAAASNAWTLDIAADAPDGAVLAGRVSAEHDGASDLSGFELVVAAPELQIAAGTTVGTGWLEPGASNELTLELENIGSAASQGGTLDLSLDAPAGVVLQTTSLALPALASGGSATAGPVILALEPSVAAGATVTLEITARHDGGAEQTTSVALPVGDGRVGEPLGPDGYGYYAYDSADYLYPDQRPVYRWQEISTTFGGPGTKLPFVSDNYDRDVVVDFPAGFSFRYYGQDFTRVRVADNGWISFDADDDYYNFYNWPLPSQHGSGAVVAPFWDNLTPEPAADPESDPVGLDSDGVFWYHDADRSELIFEWSRMRHVYADSVPTLQTFQLVLRDPATYATPTGDGEILFYYRQVADVDFMRMYASVGMESPDETDGLQLSYDQIRAPGTLPLGPGGAVRLTTAPPQRVPLTVASLARDQGEATARLDWTVDDSRPVTGWRIYTLRDGRRHDLCASPLAPGARSCEVSAGADEDLYIEALLPHGTVSAAGKSLAGGTVSALALGEPRPNPVRGESSIAFALPRGGHLRLRIFDVRGRCVRTLVDGQAAAGTGAVVWRGRDDQGRDLADGVYFYRLEHAGRTLTRKLLLVR